MAAKQNLTRSGIPIKPVYGPDDVRAPAPPPGEFPFTRGIHPTMYLGKLWTMRQYAGFGSPVETNQRFRYLLEQGQTGLSLALDLPTQLGLDAGNELAEGEVGKVGVSICSLEDVETVFDGIPLCEVSTSMTINATAGTLLAMYEAVALKQSVAPDRIAGTVQNDLLKEFGARGAWIYPIGPSMRLCVDLIEDCVERLPRFNPISIASHYRDAGATPAEEMAFTLSSGLAYVEQCLQRGMEIDRFAPRLSFFFYTYTNFFEEVAKYRAGRRLWATLLKDRFGARTAQAQMMRAACVCGGHSLTRAEPLNNIARTTLEAFAVACGGLQSVFTAAYDEAFAIPTELSARTALTVDPLAGSYFVEALTDQMEAQVLKIIADVDAQGGMVKALESGYVQGLISKRAYEAQRAIESGEQPIVGVNLFKAGPQQEPATQALSADSNEEKAAAVASLKKRRHQGKVTQTLGDLKRAAEGTQNTMPFIREAVLAYATTGEISDCLREVFGVYQPPSRF